MGRAENCILVACPSPRSIGSCGPLPGAEVYRAGLRRPVRGSLASNLLLSRPLVLNNIEIGLECRVSTGCLRLYILASAISISFYTNWNPQIFQLDVPGVGNSVVECRIAAF